MRMEFLMLDESFACETVRLCAFSWLWRCLAGVRLIGGRN